MRRCAPAVLTLIIFAGLVVAPPVHAQETAPNENGPVRLLYGLWTGGPGDRFKTTHPLATFCVRAAGPVHLGLAGVDPDQHPGYIFEPTPSTPHCRTGMGGFLMEVVAAPDEVQVLVLKMPPRTMAQPGMTAVPAGSALLLPMLAPQDEVWVSPAAPASASAFTWPGLDPLFIEGRGRIGARPGEGVVVVATHEQDGIAVRWEQPARIVETPRLGDVAAVLLLALLVTLYRGTPGRSVIPLPPRR